MTTAAALHQFEKGNLPSQPANAKILLIRVRLCGAKQRRTCILQISVNFNQHLNHPAYIILITNNTGNKSFYG